MFTADVVLVLACAATISLTVLVYLLVMPKKFDGKLANPFLQWVHDFFHFKKLYIEEVLKFFYVVLTLFIISFGFFAMLGEDFFVEGLTILVGGPIAVRLIYEMSLMFILMVKNTIEINNKLGKKDTAPKVTEAAPVSRTTAPANRTVAPASRTATQPAIRTWTCPTCGQAWSDQVPVCSCGTPKNQVRQ